MKQIAICGSGGLANELTCLINTINKKAKKWDFIGYFVNDLPKGTKLQYGYVVGNDNDLNQWKEELDVVIAVGNPLIVQKIASKITNPLIEFPNIIAPHTTFLDYDSVKMGVGNIICPNSLISCNVEIGNHNLINYGTFIGHDCHIGDCNIILPSVNLSGGIRIGNTNLFGVKSTVIQYLEIGNQCVIGAGSTLLRNTKDECTYIGTPAREIKM